MQLDDTKHKVYIYNLDDELSDSDSSSDENKLVFLNDIDKHLRNSRIPASVLANRDGKLAGRNLNNELVLYNIPSSLTVTEDKDSVRKAIIETRARAQEKQRKEREIARTAPAVITTGQKVPEIPRTFTEIPNGVASGSSAITTEADEDSDAMDID
jgi:hypothetical protein